MMGYADCPWRSEEDEITKILSTWNGVETEVEKVSRNPLQNLRKTTNKSTHLRTQIVSNKGAL